MKIYRAPSEDLQRAGLDPKTTRFTLSNEYRAPRKGEFYLSGAIPCTYLAKGDLKTKYRIMRPVQVKQTPEFNPYYVPPRNPY